MKKRRTALTMALSSFWIALSWSQATSAFSITAYPSLDIPLGMTLPESSSTPLYSIGYGASLRGEYALPFARGLSAGLVFDADVAPLNSSDKSATFLGAAGELAYTLYPIPRLSLRTGAQGGMYRGSFEGEPVVQPYVAGSMDIAYLINPSLGAGIGATYKSYLPFGDIYNGLAIRIGAQFHLGAGKAVLKVEPRLQPIFPLFYSYYDKNPVGEMDIRNNSSSEMRDVSVKFFVKQFMDQPKECWSADSLAAGTGKSVPVFALFKDSIFSVTEGTKVAGEMLVSYTYLGKDVQESIPVTVAVNNRNGMTWDDTNKIAAFVTSMDPSVRGFSLPIASMARTRGNQAVSTNFRIAMALLDALKIHEVGYVSDPVSPFETRTASKEAVDYLQFPVQTLAYKGGDCDDLSILYAALIESAGIGSAFLTIPGHIYVAFDLGMTEGEASGFFKDPSSLISRDGEAWLPVEITRVQEGFVKAVQSGVQEWKAATRSGGACFFPVREAWKTFAPANTGAIVKDLPSAPSTASVGAAYDAEIQRFFVQEYQPRIDALKAEIAKGGDTLKQRNRLGILYARFGMLSDAQKQFEFVSSAKGVSPALASAALINLGNIAYLGAKYLEASQYYGRALEFAPDNPVAVLGYARAAFELGKTSETNAALDKLQSLDPSSAAKYAYMATGGMAIGRAASAEKEISAWSDSE
jgi:hypothetical protein